MLCVFIHCTSVAWAMKIWRLIELNGYHVMSPALGVSPRRYIRDI